MLLQLLFLQPPELAIMLRDVAEKEKGKGLKLKVVEKEGVT